MAVWWGCCREGMGRPSGSAGGAVEKSPPPQETAEEKRKDPADGKLYTLKELKTFYKGQYSVKEVEAYWRDSCEVLVAAVAGKGKGKKKEAKTKPQEEEPTAASPVVERSSEGWPAAEYPLPLMPPASFFAMDEIADYAMKQHAKKAAKATRLRQEWGSSSKTTAAGTGAAGEKKATAGGYATSTTGEAEKQKDRRWAKKGGSAATQKQGSSYYPESVKGA